MDAKNTHCRWCSAPNCNNSKNKRPELGFFYFPLDPERSKKWVINSRREDLEGKSVKHLHRNNVMCELHFEPCCRRKTKRKLLVNDAVPTLFDIPNPPPKITISRPLPRRLPLPDSPPTPPLPPTIDQSEITNTPGPSGVEVSLTTQTSLKRKLQLERTKTHRLRKKLKLSQVSEASSQLDVTPDQELQTIKEILSKYLSEKSYHFVMTQIRVSKLSKKGRRWTHKDKSFALSIYHASRKAYKLLQRELNLPSPKTLSLSMKNVNIRPGFCQNIIELFKIKIRNMSSEEKLCAIVIDEMAIKKAIRYDVLNDEVEGLENFGDLGKTNKYANESLVFMVRGIIQKWKQPLTYFLSNGPTKMNVLKCLLLETVGHVIELGLSPKVIIWDQGSGNRAVMKMLGVTEEQPFFCYQDRKVFAMFDPPHLMKSIINNLKRHGFRVNGEVISWDFIKKFYEIDSVNPIRSAPKLTKKLIFLPAFANLSVRLAVQVLSHTVAAGISTMVAFKALPQEALNTARFVDNFDQLFNCFNNSRALNSRSPMGHAITHDSGHVEFLQQQLVWFRQMRCNNKTGVLPCIDGWKLTISCLLQLWKDLNTSCNVRFFLTSRLNQDCLENLFSVIRAKGGHRYNPDSREFRTAIAQTMVDAILITGEEKNCKDDVDSFLFSFENIKALGCASSLKTRLEIDVPRPLQPLLQTSQEMSLFTNNEENILVYIGGYIARKLRSIVCDQCKSALVQERSDTNVTHIFLQNKQYAGCTQGGLIAPSTALLAICQLSEKVFRDSISSHTLTPGIRFKLVKKMEIAVASVMLQCQKSVKKCQVKFMALNLFSNIRIHHHIKVLNREISAPNQTRKIERKAATFGN